MAAPNRIEKIEELDLHPNLVTLKSSQSIAFDLDNPNPNSYLHTNSIRITVLDAPILPTNASVATMMIPIHREADWIFSTNQGHRQLLMDNPQFSRIVIIDNTPFSDMPITYVLDDCLSNVERQRKLQEGYWTCMVRHYMCPVFPIVYDVTPLTYNTDRNVICRSWREYEYEGIECQIWIEVIGLQLNNNGIEFRRRLKFKETPDVIQTEILVVPNPLIETSLNLVNSIALNPVFQPNTQVLVQPYLNAMVKGLSLIRAPNANTTVRRGSKTKCLCIGVGGGALVSFLNERLGFDVVGVEVRRDVLSVARNLFGLRNGQFVKLIHGNGIKLIGDIHGTWQRTRNWSMQLPDRYRELDAAGQNYTVVELYAKFDVILVDLVTNSIPVTSPPFEFMNDMVLRSAKGILHAGHGLLVINLLRLDQPTFDTLVKSLKECFHSVYRIVVGNNETGNLVLIASSSTKPVVGDEGMNDFSARVRSVISEDHLLPMEKI